MKKRAWVVVLGDVGRSPRMQYHASSLCKTGDYDVNLVGYGGSALIQELHQEVGRETLSVSTIPSIPGWIGKLPKPLGLPMKAVAQAIILLWMLLVSLPRADVILLQIPPAIPTMIICSVVAWVRRSRLVYDWHNFGYTLMALSLGHGHPIVKMAKFYERSLARSSHGAICVTKAMQSFLRDTWKASSTVFYDSPPDIFKPSSAKEAHELFVKLSPILSSPMHPHDWLQNYFKMMKGLKSRNNKTIITEKSGPAVDWVSGDGQPVVVVSSTSWTSDEDFGILLDAMVSYDSSAVKYGNELPCVLLMVTGKGPQKSMYEDKMRTLNLQKVAIRTVWLEPEDYPILLGSVDLGISLHASSSGLDLPMKVVDMFGSRLPVCALSYPCLCNEMVTHGQNGLVFSDATELKIQLVTLLKGYRRGQDDSSNLLSQLHKKLKGQKRPHWHETWSRIVLPVLEHGN